MSNRSPSHNVWGRVARVTLTLFAVVLLLSGAGFASYLIKQSEPTAEREAATRRTAAMVETITVDEGVYSPSITALGTVQAARDIVLSSRVNGQVLSVEESFTLGGRVQAGELLLRLDPSDYKQALVMRESEMLQVKAELAIEEGQQRVARREFELLGTDLDEVNRSLVLREPQIESLRAKLNAAEASVQRARIDLERTEIFAPFNGQILDRSAELGSQISAGDELARLVGTETYWVIATIPINKLRWIEFPNDNQGGAMTIISHSSAWQQGERREGRVKRLIGELDQRTRMARVIVEVPQPLGNDHQPELILGSIVQVDIAATPLQGVIRLDRAYLRQDDTVWVMEDGKLRIREVAVLFSDAAYAYIGEGLDPGEHVVTTSLATVVDGLDIRVASDAEVDDPTQVSGGSSS